MSAPPLYERWDATTQRHTEVITDTDTGLPLIVRTQNTRPVVESAKRLAANFDKHTHGKGDFVHVARIDINTWANLTRLGITRDPVAFNKWLDSREARYFRTDDSRRI
jgi:hypothetical protein